MLRYRVTSKKAQLERAGSWGWERKEGGRFILTCLQTVLFQGKRAKKGQLPVAHHPSVNSNHLLLKVRARHFTK